MGEAGTTAPTDGGIRSWALGGSRRVSGVLRVPGDKSISHRALILGALAEGDTEIAGWLQGADCRATLGVLSALGVSFSHRREALHLVGRGPEALQEAEGVLDAQNSGTTLRLMAGVLAGRPVFSVLTGDGSLCKRPMRRIVEPLSAMGATLWGRAGGQLPPLAIRGGALRGIHWRSPVASAQVKSAILLAGLQAEGETAVSEPVVSRDHTERMLEAFGAPVRRVGTTVWVAGGQRLQGRRLTVPGDLSSAAFFLVAAAARPGDEVVVRDVGVNPTRTGLLAALERMGADVRCEGRREEGGEPVADVVVRGRRLRGTTVDAAEIPRLLDEVPILAVAALLADGESRIDGAGELRVKEVDRLAALEGEFRKLGGAIRVEGDSLVIEGGKPLHGDRVASRGDHRMAMSLAVAALFADGETTIQGVECVETSFPGFAAVLREAAPDCGLTEVTSRE